MKKLLFLFAGLVFLNASVAQEFIEVDEKLKDSIFTTRIEMQDEKKRNFQISTHRTAFTTEEITKYFKIPHKIASKYPMQIIYLANFSDLNNVSLNDVIGISVYQITPERTEHYFYKNENQQFSEVEEYAAIFTNGVPCSYYGNIFNVELAKTPYFDENPAYFFISNEDVPFRKKTKADMFFTENYNAFFGIKDSQNQKVEKMKKLSDSLGFKVVKVVESKAVVKP